MMKIRRFDAAGRVGLRRSGWSAAVVLSALVLSASSARAEGAAAAPVAGNAMLEEQLARIPTGDAGVKKILSDLETRLALRGDQLKDIRPAVKDVVAQMDVAVEKFRAGGVAPMALIMQLQMAGKRSAALIEPILDEGQLTEYRKMQLEQRQEMMREMMKSQQQLQKAQAASGDEG